MKTIVKLSEAPRWIGDVGKNRRIFSLIFDTNETPTINIAAVTSTLPPGNDQGKVSHHDDAEEIYFILSGKGEFLLDDRWFDVEKDTAIYVGPGVGHCCKNTGDTDLVMFAVCTPSVLGPVHELMKTWEKIE